MKTTTPNPKSSVDRESAELSDKQSLGLRRIPQSANGNLALKMQRRRLMLDMFDIESEPMLLGHCVLLREVGRGAMGVVYEGYDRKLDRKVAIKIMIVQEDLEMQRRFVREAKAMARFTHPNVVQVHEIGNIEGTPFIVMEYVEGVTVHDWLTKPRSLSDILETFQAAGRGLAAVHERGMVHRDFKPANVMIREGGQVLVMDFGLAGGDLASTIPDGVEVDESAGEVTRSGGIMGTPAYMSPEQFSGYEVTAQTDQFSFCVALWEALYGQRPFQGKTMGALRDAVVAGNMTLPEFGKGSVPVWIRRILARGLHADSSQRFESMQALLDALLADPATWRRKWSVVAMLVAGLSGTAWGVWQAAGSDAQWCVGMANKLVGVWDNERRDEVQAAIEGTGLTYAPGTWTRVNRRLGDYTTQWVEARTEACDATHRGVQSETLLDLRMACLDQRLLHLGATVDILAGADESVVEKAVSAVMKLPALERCADTEALLAEVPPPEDPEVAERVTVLLNQLTKAAAEQNLGKYDEALVIADEVQRKAMAIDYEPLKARVWLRQGEIQQFAGQYEVAERTLAWAYDAAVAHRMTAEAASASALLVGVVGPKLARYPEARRWAVNAEPLSRALGSEPDRAFIHRQLGALAFSEGKLSEARAHFEQELEIREEIAGPDHALVAACLDNLGAVASSEGKYEDASRHLERALAIDEKTFGPQHPNLAYSLTNLGVLAYSQHKYGETRSYFERALAIRKATLGPNHPEVAKNINNLGVAGEALGEYDLARKYYEQALGIHQRTLAPNHPEVARCLYNLGNVAAARGEYDEARGYHQQALVMRQEVLGPDHPDVAYSLYNLGVVAHLEGENEEARGYHERALTIREKVLGSGHRDVGYSLKGLGEALLGQRKSDVAVPHLDRAVTILTTTESDPGDLADVQFALARAVWEASPNEEDHLMRARELAEFARTMYTEDSENFARQLEEVESWLAEHLPN